MRAGRAGTISFFIKRIRQDNVKPDKMSPEALIHCYSVLNSLTHATTAITATVRTVACVWLLSMYVYTRKHDKLAAAVAAAAECVVFCKIYKQGGRAPC